MDEPIDPRTNATGTSDQALAGLQEATLEGIASDLKASTPKATASTAAAGGAPEATPSGTVADHLAALRDPHGNPFDPELHLADGAGNPALSRGGRLMAKAGMGPSCKARALARKTAGGAAGRDTPKAAKAPSSTLHLNDNREAQHEEEHHEEEAPQVSAEERAQRAQMDAETVADTEDILLDILVGGTLTPEERSRLERSAKRVMEQDDIELPIGAKTLHSMEVVRVFNRRAKTPEGKAQLTQVGQFVRDSVREIIQLFNGAQK